jgi:hypothetical protein
MHIKVDNDHRSTRHDLLGRGRQAGRKARPIAALNAKTPESSMNQLTLGFSPLPRLDVSSHRELVATADAEGLDLVGIQDHPYVPDYVDSVALAATLLAGTNGIKVLMEMTNLPLQAPTLLARPRHPWT